MNCPHIFPWEVVNDHDIETKNYPARWNRRIHRARSLGTVCDSRLLQFCLDRRGRSWASAHACQRCRHCAAHGAALRSRRVQLLVLSDKQGDHPYPDRRRRCRNLPEGAVTPGMMIAALSVFVSVAESDDLLTALPRSGC